MPTLQIRSLAVIVACLALTVHSGSAATDDTQIPAVTSPSLESSDAMLVAKIRQAAHPLAGNPGDYDPLMALIGDARIVMIGEATHGSREFYRERARITRRLIEEKGFNAVVIEADWPQIRRVDQYIRSIGTDSSVEQALSEIVRFPRWAWRNMEFRDFAEWMRKYNASRLTRMVGVYGMDLYSVPESVEAVVSHLEQRDPVAASKARTRYRCFSRFVHDPYAYGRAVALKKARSCKKQVQQQFKDIQHRFAASTHDAELFSALQDARVAKNGEAYYRVQHRNFTASWNLRDRHMAETLDALMRHLDSSGDQPAKIVVLAHNSHQGDARMSDQAMVGELNVGQLMRERYRQDVVLVGFTTYVGTVRASSEWRESDEVKNVLPALAGSIPALFHEAGKPDTPNFLLRFRDNETLAKDLEHNRLDRVIGVLYLPQTERTSHYYNVRLSRQFDAVIHLDVTHAVEPLN